MVRREHEPLVIDCDTCALQGTRACKDCVVTFLCGEDGAAPVSTAVVIDADRLRTLRRLHQVGLVPRLRHRPRRCG